MFRAPNTPFGGGSSTPFGGAPAAPFGSSAPAPFGGGGGFGAPAPTGFGAAPAPGGFGSAPAPGGFGAAPAAPAFGQPTFGAPAAPSFGGFGSSAPAPSGFGAPPAATPFGGAPASSGGLFGAPPPAPSGGLFGSSTTNNAAPTSAFGGGGFGSPAPAPFGGTGGAFGAPAPSAFGAPAPSAFGAPGPSGGLFGAPAPAPLTFGAPAPATGGMFGAPSAPSGGMFGAPAPGQQQGGSKMVPFSVTIKQDGNNSTSQISFQSITAMPQYEAKSFEELRFEDYSMGNKGDGSGSSAGGGFGSTAFGAPAPTGFGAAAPAASGLFGAPAPSAFGAPAPSAFGAPAPAPFGAPAAPAFGAAPAGGAFGAPSSFAAPASGGLFGAKPPASGGIFGSPSPAPSGGLFGNPAPAFGAAPAQAFGAPAFGAPAPSPSGGLFGAPASGGLFGAPSPAPSGSIFGAPAPAPSGGLFGSPAPASGGLFGAPAPPSAFGAAPAPGGSLFGAPAPAAGGLFGSKPTSGGLFGAPSPAPGGLFGSPTPAPTMGLFGAPPPAAPPPVFASPIGAPANIIPPAADAALQQQLTAIENQKKEMEKLDVWRGKSPSASSIIGSSLSESDVINISPYSEARSLSSYRASPKSATKIRPRGFGMSTTNSPRIGNSFGTGGTPMHTPAKIAASSAKRLTIKPEAHTPKAGLRLRLTNASLQQNGEVPGGAPLPVENGKVSPKAVDLLPAPPKQTPSPVQSPPRYAMKEGAPMGQKPPNPSDSAHEFYNQVVGSPKPPSAPTNRGFAPKLTKPDYVTTPSLAEMTNMPEASLAALSGFSIRRDGFGTVEWEGTVDVRGVDLDTTVSIELQDVAVYEEEEKRGTKPSVGEKLNRPAIIILHQTFPKGGANAPLNVKEKFRKKLEAQSAAMGVDFISYDADTGVWKFRVHHFSRYGLYDDDSDDDEIAPPKQGARSLANFEAGERGGRSQDDRIGSRTRFTMPQDIDADDVHMMMLEDKEEESALVSDAEQVQNLAQETYKAMFLSPRVETVPIVEEQHQEEAHLVFEDEAVYFPPPTQPIVPAPREEDMGFFSDKVGISSRIMQQCGISGSNIDIGIRMGRSFRIGWRPDGSFLHLKSGSVLAQSRPLFSYPQSTTVGVLNAHSKHACKNIKEGFSLAGHPTVGLSHAVQDMIAAIRQGGEASHRSEALTQAFALILCLLNTKDGSSGVLVSMADDDSLLAAIENNKTMEAFRRWLKSACSSAVQTDIASAKQRGAVHEAIFAAISGGDVPLAASIATENRYLQLAAMITSGTSAAAFIREQVRQWHATGAAEKIPRALLRIYTVMGGDLQQEETYFKNGDKSCDWMRRLGLLLMYGTKEDGCDYEFASLVAKYDADVAAGTAPRPKPLYARAASQETEATNLLYSLVHLCNAIGQGQQEPLALSDIVQPLGHTPCDHDFSGSFQLASVLSALTCCTPLTELEQARLLSGYASQLICEGKWEFAVYVTLCSVGQTSLREWRLKQAKEIIAQNYWPESKSLESFLTEKACVPMSWLKETLAERCSNAGNMFGQVNHLIGISRDAARVSLEEVLLPTVVFRNNVAATKSLEYLRSFAFNSDSLTNSIIAMYDLSHEIMELSNQRDSPASRIKSLCEKADSIEKQIAAHKAALESLSYPPLQKSQVPMNCFLSECLLGILFLKLQLGALECGESIWDERSVNAPMKLSSQLVGGSSALPFRSRAVKGYN